MKRRQHMLKCGRVIYYKEYTPKDIGHSMKSTLMKHRKTLSSVLFKTRGRVENFPKDAYQEFATYLNEFLFENLMDGNRIETQKGRMWMIAGKDIPNNKHINWHTDGLSYGIYIKGLLGSYGIRMTGRARRQLRKKIEGGFTYHQLT